MLGNDKNNGTAAAASSNTNTTNNLRDICNFLQPITLQLDPHGCPYDHIIEMIRGLDLEDDGIQMNHKIKSIETDFCNIVRDESMLWQSMQYINDKALGDGETALKFALLFSSRNFDALAMNETKVRTAMLTILQTNFMNADKMRDHDRERLYNSITLLGEYYHRVRLADNTPVRIVGESLLELLLREVQGQEAMSAAQAKLLLSQITLNGDMLRLTQAPQLTQLFFHIRRQLIEQPVLRASVKALLLMTLDLYYSNFANLGSELEAMYTTYLVQPDDDEGNNNAYQPQSTARSQTPKQPVSAYKTSPPQPHSQVIVYSSPQQEQLSEAATTSPASVYENGDEPAVNDIPKEVPKKWSEQVCEESMLESEFAADVNSSFSASADGVAKDTSSSSNHFEYDLPRRNARRGRQPSNRPQQQQQQLGGRREDYHNKSNHTAGGEELDESKPLPRWRAPRFNRDPAAAGDGMSQQRGGGGHQQRRYSASYEDDGQSVRSEGGSIRLYSISDRLKHSQEKIERSGVGSGGNAYNYIANSNWDRQSQRDDRSERSYISNYECGNYRRGGGRRNQHHHRQTYDKPPRFQKHQQHQQHYQPTDDQKIHSDSWRRTQGNNYHDENTAYRLNSGDGESQNSRSSSGARTLPRRKSQWPSGSSSTEAAAYRRSQSPQTRGQQQRSRHFSGAARYSSQSSLASESAPAMASTLERRRNQRNNNYAPPARGAHKRWDGAEAAEQSAGDAMKTSPPAAEEELVRNARQTTKYMNYLSSQK